MSLPFPEENQSYPTHSQVLDYLGSYTDQHMLRPLISLGCNVENVRPLHFPGADAAGGAAASDHDTGGESSGQARVDGEDRGTLGKWEVVYRRESAGGVTEGEATAARVMEVFDAVCVCNGHYDEANAPPIEGHEGFRGANMHAREYDRPDVEEFVGKRVLCVGAGYSAADIVREVASVGESFVFHLFEGILLSEEVTCVEMEG